REVRVDVAIGVLVDGPEHGRPRTLQDQISAPARGDGLALVVVDVRLDSRERPGRGPRLQRGDAGARRDEDLARLRLPPGVHNRAALGPDALPVPHPGL